MPGFKDIWAEQGWKIYFPKYRTHLLASFSNSPGREEAGTQNKVSNPGISRPPGQDQRSREVQTWVMGGGWGAWKPLKFSLLLTGWRNAFMRHICFLWAWPLGIEGIPQFPGKSLPQMLHAAKAQTSVLPVPAQCKESVVYAHQTPGQKTRGHQAESSRAGCVPGSCHFWKWIVQRRSGREDWERGENLGSCLPENKALEVSRPLPPRPGEGPSTL